MRRTTTGFWVLASGMLLSAAGHGAGAPPEMFRLSYAGGTWTSVSLKQDVVYAQEVSFAATDTAAARNIRDRRDTGFEVVFRSVSTRPDGAREVEVEYRAKWLRVLDDNGGPAVADFAPTIGKRMTFRLLADGTVEDVKGHESFPEVLDPVSRRPISRTDYLHDIGHLLPRLPAGPVSIGSGWEAPQFSEPGSTLSPIMYRYQVLDRVTKNGEDCLRIVATYADRQSIDGPGPSGGTATREVDQAGIATYYFSLKRGMIVAKVLSWQGSGRMTRTGQLLSEGKTRAMYECNARFE